MQEAERLLRDYLESGDRGDYTKLESVLHADVITHSPGDVTIHGFDSQVIAWKTAHEGLDELAHEVESVVAAGQSAVARIRVSGVHRGTFLGAEPTEVPIEVDQALFVETDGSRIVEMWEIVDTGSGLRQLGLVGEQPLSPGAGPTG